ncbi:MAG: hypothetical protein AAGD01_09730 [Acidobacteriota bacterium]
MTTPFTQDTFSPLVGKSLPTTVGELSFDLKVLEVTAAGGTPREGQQPFSVIFEAPAGTLIEQQIVSVQHPELGELGLFLVPLQSDEQGVQYEAVFT